MLDWIKNINKEYPEFWKNYLSKFDKKASRYVVLSTETTGLNPNKDVILSFGAIAVVNDSIVIGDSFELVLLQYKFLHDNGLSNEFIIESKQPKLERMDCGRMKNEALDIEIMYRKLMDISDKQFSIDDLCSRFKVVKSDRHSSAEDAYTIALLFLKLKSRLGITF